jgi:hypothetical protein
MLSRIVLGLGLTIGAWSTASAQDHEAMMTPPPPLTDSTLLNLVGGTWGGDLVMGDHTSYGEAQFTLGVGQQWIVGNFGMWSDKTKAKALPMGFVMYLRPGAAAGSYKAVQFAGDGSMGNGTATRTDGILNWAWTYDNGMKEVGTLTLMAADHIVYKASIVDGSGNKIMDFQHEMHRTKEK